MLKHINENQRAVGREHGVFYATDDGNVVRRIWTASEEIRIDKLEKRIADLEASIGAAPALKTEPDRECLDLWNGMNVRDTADEKAELDRLIETLSKARG